MSPKEKLTNIWRIRPIYFLCILLGHQPHRFAHNDKETPSEALKPHVQPFEANSHKAISKPLKETFMIQEQKAEDESIVNFDILKAIHLLNV